MRHLRTAAEQWASFVPCLQGPAAYRRHSLPDPQAPISLFLSPMRLLQLLATVHVGPLLYNQAGHVLNPVRDLKL